MAPLRTWIFTLSLGLLVFAPAEGRPMRNYSAHSGYLDSTFGEREQRFEDLIFIPKPVDNEPPLQDRIFTNELSKEFRDRYGEKFGRTEAERAYFAPNRFTYYNDVFGFQGSVVESYDEQRSFAEFMGRRLAEYHVDHKIKNDPGLRPAYEVKERLSNVKMEVAKGYRIRAKYSLSGNYLDLNLDNPWVDSRVRMDFKEGMAIEETLLTLGHSFTPRISVESHYAVSDGIVRLVGRRSLTESLSTSLTGSTYVKDYGVSVRENLVMAGFMYIY